MVTPSSVESAVVDMLCSVAVTLSAADEVDMMRRVTIVVLPAATVSVMSSASEKELRSDARKAGASKEATSPAAVMTMETTGRYVDPGPSGGGDGGGGEGGGGGLRGGER